MAQIPLNYFLRQGITLQNVDQDIYTAPSQRATIVLAINAANLTSQSQYVTLSMRAADSTDTIIIDEVEILPNNSENLNIGGSGKLILNVGDTIVARATQNGTVDLCLSLLESFNTSQGSTPAPTPTPTPTGTYLSIVPSATTIDEGDPISFTVLTSDISDGTVVFWTVQSITADGTDLLEGPQGNFAILSDTGSFIVNVANDETSEGVESFRVQIRTGSATGPVVLTSDEITINDTSVEFGFFLGAELGP